MTGQCIPSIGELASAFYNISIIFVLMVFILKTILTLFDRLITNTLAVWLAINPPVFEHSPTSLFVHITFFCSKVQKSKKVFYLLPPNVA